jgi:hypothetical protein
MKQFLKNNLIDPAYYTSGNSLKKRTIRLSVITNKLLLKTVPQLEIRHGRISQKLIAKLQLYFFK